MDGWSRDLSPSCYFGVGITLLECNEDGKDVILSTNTVEAEGYLFDV